MSGLTSCLSVLASSALCVVGCATGGQAWVQQPENALGAATPPEHVSDVGGDALTLPRVTGPNLTQERKPPRHRLDHVVTLPLQGLRSVVGEGAPSAAAPTSNADPAGRLTPAVVVNIVNHAAPAYGYSEGYYRTHAYRTSPVGPSHLTPTLTHPTQGTPPLGHDWQAPPSYGPTFPYHTAPASPWERAR